MSILTTVESILGDSFLAIRMALSVLAPRRLNLPQCTFRVVGSVEGATLLVRGPAGDGSPGVLGVHAATGKELTPAEVGTAELNPDPDTPANTIRGTSWPVLRAAADVFLQRSPNPDLAQYSIEMVREGETIVVIFADRDRQPGARGAIRGRPGFEVAFNEKDLTVLRANFVR